VSGITHKGRHTTTGARLVPLDGPAGGSIVDTAGIRALAVSPSALARLDWCFREFRPHLPACHLSDCTHVHEPDCGVRSAVREGLLDRERYDSYRRMFRGGADAAGADWEGIV
jgi:ribosome biogenesis GTPase / thiamine phosphate phosphatase